MDNYWIRIDTKTNKILLKIKNDDILNEIWENNEYEMSQDGFSKKYNDFNDTYEIQFWIDKEEENENDKIIEFNEKCKKWKIKQYIEKNVYLTIYDDIDFNNFYFIKDENFNEEWNNYLFTYNNKNTYIKIDNINVNVEMDNFNNKYIDISEKNIIFDKFMKKLEDKIISCKNENEDNFNIEKEYQYKYYKNNNGDYRFKIKKDNIEIKQYDNATIYIKFNRLWKLNYHKKDENMYNWGVSLIVDRIY